MKLPKVEFRKTEDVLEVYSQDASRWYRVKPLGVFFPKNLEEAQKCVEFCYKNGIPITPRGGGSGLTGGAVPEDGGVVISTEKMKNFSIEEGFFISEAGAIPGEIEKEANKIGYTLPAQPSSLNFSTIGGNVATDAAGLRSVKYGSARDHILELEVILPDGKIKTFGPEESQIFAGSEGTLGLISKVKMKLVKLKKRKTFVFLSENLKQTIQFSFELLKFLPSALEFVDKNGGKIVDVGNGDFYIIISEFEEDFDGKIDLIQNELAKIASEFGMKIEEIKDIWERRKKLGPALSKIRQFKINEDIVLPISKITDFVEFARKKIVEEEKINCVIFGHIGVGILHTNLLFGGGEEKDAEKAKREIFEFVISQGGAITGEHGTGISKKDFIQNELGEETLNFMRHLKNKIDPKNIFNPTKPPLPKRGCIDTTIK
jgi:glycolate oxidase/D-lactate dehydrogenase